MRCINCGTEYEGEACPQCGLSARYCRVLYRWEERQREKREAAAAGRPIAPRRQNKQENGKNTAKLVIGIISIAVFGIIVFQSCAAGIANAFGDGSDLSATGGLIVAFLMLIAGIVGIATRKTIGGGAATAALYALGAFAGFFSQGIFGDLMVWSFMALAFSVAFLVMTITSLPSGMFLRKWWFYVVAVLALLSIIGMFFGGSEEKETAPKKDETQQNADGNDKKPLASDSPTGTDQGSSNADSGELITDKITVKYQSHSVVKDSSGNDVLRVVVEFQNHTDEAVSYSLAAYAQAYQDGIELDSAYLYDETEVESGSTEVKKDVPITVASYFSLRNNSSDVEFEVSESFSFSDSKLHTVLKLQ